MRWIYMLASVCLVLQLVAPNRPALVSPEVLPDRSVVFRFWAPQASEVKLSGNWMGPQPPSPLTKGDDGVWTASSGAEYLLVRFYGRWRADH